MRLDKYVSYTLDLTRTEAKNIIKQKIIKVNDVIIINPNHQVDENADIITYKDQVLKYYQHIYLMMNKPIGYLSATFDSREKTVLDLINEYKKYNLFIVGRLDIDSCGLLILTNDGALSHEVTSPQSKIPKTYYVEVNGKFTQNDVTLFEKGLYISDGKGEMFTTDSARLDIITDTSGYITITEGKFHQIKNMCKKVGKEVTYLKRVKIGLLELDEDLLEGEYRHLTNFEVEQLKMTHII